MKSYKLIIAAALISLSASAQIKSSDFPAELQILAHLDVKSLYSSKTGDLIKSTMDDKSNRKLDSFKALSGIDVMKDLDSIYFAGIGTGEGSGVVYASGRFDTEKLTSILGGNNGFKSEACGSHQVITWVDDEETHHGCFVNPTLAIASENMDSLKKALGAIDGTGAKLPATSPFATIVKRQPNRFAAIKAQKVSGMAETVPQLSMLKQAESLDISINQTTSDNADLLIKAALKTPTAEAAQQMGAMVMGLQAMMMMQAAQNPEIAALAQNFKSEIKDTNISMSLKITEAQLKKQIADGMKKANAPDDEDNGGMIMAEPPAGVQ